MAARRRASATALALAVLTTSSVQAQSQPPDGKSQECAQATKDLASYDVGTGRKIVRGIGRALVWPLAESGADRRFFEIERAREAMLRACTTIPKFDTADADPSQIWPFGQGYKGRVRAFRSLAGRELFAFPHPTTNVLWLKPLKPIGDFWPSELWPAAASEFLAPVGCKVSQTRPGPAGTFEAAFVCPAGVDVFMLTKAQARALAKGQQLAPQNN